MLTLAHKAALSRQRLCGPSLPDVFVARLIRGPSRCHLNLLVQTLRGSPEGFRREAALRSARCESFAAWRRGSSSCC